MKVNIYAVFGYLLVFLLGAGSTTAFYEVTGFWEIRKLENVVRVVDENPDLEEIVFKSLYKRP